MHAYPTTFDGVHTVLATGDVASPGVHDHGVRTAWYAQVSEEPAASTMPLLVHRPRSEAGNVNDSVVPVELDLSDRTDKGTASSVSVETRSLSISLLLVTLATQPPDTPALPLSSALPSPHLSRLTLTWPPLRS